MNLKALHKKIRKTTYSTILFPVLGSFAQVLFLVGVYLAPNSYFSLESNLVLSNLFAIVLTLWFLIPLLSIYGIYVAFRQMKQKPSWGSSIGLLSNTIWFVLFIFFVAALFSGQLVA